MNADANFPPRKRQHAWSRINHKSMNPFGQLLCRPPLLSWPQLTLSHKEEPDSPTRNKGTPMYRLSGLLGLAKLLH